MAFQKGHKLATGRPKGRKNERTLLVRDIAARVSIDPLEVLFKLAAGDWKGLGYDNECFFHEKPDGVVKMGYTISIETRLVAAKEASQYLYPKKKEEEEKPDEIEVYSLEDKIQMLEEAKKEIARLETEILKDPQSFEKISYPNDKLSNT